MISTSQILERESSPHSTLLGLIGLVIPTWNAGKYWSSMEKAIGQQGIAPDQVLIIDSSSSDNTRSLARDAGYRLKVISQQSFGHGVTRQLAAELSPRSEILVYLTQDALLCNEKSLENLVAAFRNPDVGACYGRQLPRADAGPIERHARLFNYPEVSALRTFEDRQEYGIRAAFFSNSFAAYRRSAFEEVGGFPLDTIVSEDVSLVARMLMAGRKVAYQADATVIHSHDFTLTQEFSRYFDIGVHHSRERWIVDEFGSAKGEGRKFVLSEIRFLCKSAPGLLPVAAIRSANKWCAYQLGRHEGYLPHRLKRALSAQKWFWARDRNRQ